MTVPHIHAASSDTLTGDDTTPNSPTWLYRTADPDNEDPADTRITAAFDAFTANMSVQDCKPRMYRYCTVLRQTPDPSDGAISKGHSLSAWFGSTDTPGIGCGVVEYISDDTVLMSGPSSVWECSEDAKGGRRHRLWQLRRYNGEDRMFMTAAWVSKEEEAERRKDAANEDQGRVAPERLRVVRVGPGGNTNC